MNNDLRRDIYLREHGKMTPAQRRRHAKRERQNDAPIKRSVIRKAKRDVVAEDRRKRLAIRVGFMQWRAFRHVKP